MTSSAVTGQRQPGGSSPLGIRWLRRAWYYLPAVAVFVSVVGAWELIVRNIDLRGLPLPAPSAILGALVDNWSNGRWPLGKAAAATLFEAVGRLAIANALGALLA